MNPIVQMLNQNTQSQGANLSNLLGVLKNAKNPQALLNQIAGQNPQMKQILDMVQQNGNNPKALFYKLAKEKGIDP